MGHEYIKENPSLLESSTAQLDANVFSSSASRPAGLTKKKGTNNNSKWKAVDLDALQRDSSTKALSISHTCLSLAVMDLEKELDRKKDRKKQLQKELYATTMNGVIVSKKEMKTRFQSYTKFFRRNHLEDSDSDDESLDSQSSLMQDIIDIGINIVNAECRLNNTLESLAKVQEKLD